MQVQIAVSHLLTWIVREEWNNSDVHEIRCILISSLALKRTLQQFDLQHAYGPHCK